MPKASDFSKRLKASHLGGQPRKLTIGQVGVEKVQKRNKQDIVIFAGEGMESPDKIKTEQIIYLWFRETGATRSMRVNESNLDILIKARGDDFKSWVNTKVVLTPDEIFAFGKQQETIVITDVEAPTPKPQPAAVPESNLPAGDAVTRGRTKPTISPVQRNKLSELYKMLNQTDDEATAKGLNDLFTEKFKHGTDEATYEEAAKLTGELLTVIRAQNQTA